MNEVFKKTELEKLSNLGNGDAIKDTSYDRRSKRLSHEAAPASDKPASEIPKSQRVNPNLSRNSNASKPPSVAARSNAPPASNHSYKSAAAAPSSKREIRTGGFSNLGSQIVAN